MGKGRERKGVMGWVRGGWGWESEGAGTLDKRGKGGGSWGRRGDVKLPIFPPGPSSRIQLLALDTIE